MNNKLIYLCLVFAFCSCSVSKNLKSTQGKDYWNSEFDSFSGHETIVIPKKENAIAYVSSDVSISEGELALSIDKQNVPNQGVNHKKYDLAKDLKIEITGKNAKGSFNLKYPVFSEKKIDVQYSSNLELLNLSYFLINYEDFASIPETVTFKMDNKEVKARDLYALNLKISEDFKPFFKSKNLEIIKTYFDKDFYLHFSNFMLSLDNFPNAKLNGSFDAFSNHFKSKEDAQNFINAFNSLYQEVHFDVFLEKYKPFYEEMLREIGQNIPKENFIVEMEHLYSKKVGHYNLYPSLTMPFGQGFAVGSTDSIGNLFGSFNKPEEINDVSKLNLGYNNASSLRTICIHEFGHSFVNPTVDKIASKLIDDKSVLFEAIKQQMTEQGYNQWKICLYEHFNRAGEVLIARLLNDDVTANQILEDNIQKKSFIYLPQIVDKLQYWYNKEYLTKTYEQKINEIVSELK